MPKWIVLLIVLLSLWLSMSNTYAQIASTRPANSATTPAPSQSAKPSKPSSGSQGAGSSTSRVNLFRTIRGEASWGPFRGHIVTRYKRGTIVRVCGPLACSRKTQSWGYGPAKYTGRIADLDVSVFEHVCGPRSIGVCQVRLEVYK